MFSSCQNKVHFQDNALLKLRSILYFPKQWLVALGTCSLHKFGSCTVEWTTQISNYFKLCMHQNFRKIPFISKHLNWSVFSRKHGYPRQSTSFFVCFLSLCRGQKFYSQQSCTEVWRQLWPEQAGNVWKLRRDINGRMAYSNHANFQHIYIKSYNWIHCAIRCNVCTPGIIWTFASQGNLWPSPVVRAGTSVTSWLAKMWHAFSCVATQLKQPILSSGQPTADLKVFATKLAEKHQVARFDSAPGIIGISKIQRTWISTFTFSSFTAPDRCRDKELHTFLQQLMSCPFDTFLYSLMSFLWKNMRTYCNLEVSHACVVLPRFLILEIFEHVAPLELQRC